MKTRRTILAAALLLTVGGGVQAAPKPKPGHVEGTIAAADATATPPTVTIQGSSGPVTLKVVAGTTKIEIVPAGAEEGTAGAFSDLRAGLAAKATYEQSSLTALNIQVAPDPDKISASGKVVTVDATSLGLDTNADSTADVTVVLDAQTGFSLNKVKLTAAEAAMLKGLDATVDYNKNTFLASKVAATATPTAVSGTVTAVDLAAGTLTVQTGSDPAVTYSLLQGAEVRMKGRKLSASKILVGDKVTLAVVTNADGAKAVTRVDISVGQPQHVSGSVTAADAAAGTVTVKSRRKDVVLAVDAATDLRVNGKKSSLAQLVAALAGASSAKAEGQYFVRGSLNVATQLHVNVKSRSHGGGHGGGHGPH